MNINKHPLFLTTYLILSGLLVAIMLLGDQTFLQITRFTHTDTTFTIEFNKPIDKLAIQKSLSLSPSLPGNLSFIDKKLHYTFTTPLSYNQPLKITLLNFNLTITPKIPNLFFLQNHQLASYNFYTQSTTIFTPQNLAVFDFQKPTTTATHQKIYFLATPKNQLNNSEFAQDSQSLYSLDLKSGKIQKIFTPTTNQNLLEFSVSPNGQFVAITLLQAGQKKLLLSSTRRLNFKPFWHKNLADSQISFSPDNQALLGFSNPLGFFLSPLNPPSSSNSSPASALVELGYFDFFANFHPQSHTVAFFNYHNLLQDSTYLTLLKPNNERLTYFQSTQPAPHLDFLQFSSSTSDLFLLSQSNESPVSLLHLQNSTKLKTYSLPSGRSFGRFALTPNDQYLVLELFNSNHLPKLRTYIDSYQNAQEPANLYLLHLNLNQLYPLNLTGRIPRF